MSASVRIYERPLAAAGLKSYRCKGRFGWIMIGATDVDDAMREARRSCAAAKVADLEEWKGERYVPVSFADVLKSAIARSGQ
ncbi:hypothetical protein DF037_20215 [Burkholderia contaminans]|uniref:Uncharacterized protein n=1 Tax=Burkholderia contaminans TaxID=488447 RepID=A0A3N8QQB0_9BURK|nr:hypothetical protein DF037_20215 [Burkholderia contaminans]